MGKKNRDYVNGPALHKAFLDWYETDDEQPPEEIVRAIEQICDRLALRWNFRGYSYNDEMISEGKLVCIEAVMKRKYNPYKYENPNPFAYFTMIAFNAFVKVLNNESKESYIKHKSLVNHMIESSLVGETIEYEMDDSGRIEKLVETYEKKKKDEKTS